MPSIIVHGGAGAYSPGDEHEQALVEACRIGIAVLKRGGSACDAVVEAVVSMEDAPVLNAGYGSSLNLDGEVENDASIMLDDRSCGSVAGLTGIANPILAARLVMERTDHLLLVGRGADAFARRMRLAERDQRSPARIERYHRLLARLDAGEEIRFMTRMPVLRHELGFGPRGAGSSDADAAAPPVGSGDDPFGTVGAVVRSDDGRIAAASSTGGMMLKLPGRVGDTGVLGAGTYCDERGGVSATGHGEPVIRYGLGRALVEAFGQLGAEDAMERIMGFARTGGFEFGLIGIDARGVLTHGFTTQAMSWASLEVPDGNDGSRKSAPTGRECLRTFRSDPP